MGSEFLLEHNWMKMVVNYGCPGEGKGDWDTVLGQVAQAVKRASYSQDLHEIGDEAGCLWWKPQKPIWSKAAKFGKFTNGRWGDLFDWEFSPEPPTAKSGNPILTAIHSIPPPPRKAPGKKPNTIAGNRKLFSIFENKNEISHKNSNPDQRGACEPIM